MPLPPPSLSLVLYLCSAVCVAILFVLLSGCVYIQYMGVHKHGHAPPLCVYLYVQAQMDLERTIHFVPER